MKYLLDTNILIYIQKSQGHCLKHLESMPPQDIALCAINVMELEYGIAKSQHPQRMQLYLSELMSRYAVLPFDAPSAAQAGQLRGHLQAQGQPIGILDMQLAGIALAHKLTLVTHNTKEFARVPGLSTKDWFY